MNQVLASETDISPELANAAYAGWSMSPEKNGARARASYAETFNSFAREIREKCPEEKRDAIEAALELYYHNWNRRYTDWMRAQSRCISSFITGPSNFPVRRAEKANASERKRSDELMECRTRWENRIRKMLIPEELLPVAGSDPNAVEKLGKRAEAIQSKADRMVEINKLYRTIRKTHTDDAPAFAELFEHCDEEEKRAILSNLAYSWCKDRPYPPYAITNARANQRRVERRATHIERTREQDSQEWEGERARVVDNIEDNRIQLFFPGKPDDETRRRLKSRGFRWAPSNGAWQAYRTYAHTLDFAKEIAGVPA